MYIEVRERAFETELICGLQLERYLETSVVVDTDIFDSSQKLVLIKR